MCSKSRRDAQERGLAPCSTEKREPDWQATVKPGRHRDVRVACNGCRRGAAASIHVAIHWIDQPRRSRGQADDRVEPMFREHGIDAVRTRRLETGLARFEVLRAVEVALGVGLSQELLIEQRELARRPLGVEADEFR